MEFSNLLRFQPNVRRLLLLLLLFLASIIDSVWCDCLVKLEKCEQNFRNEMKAIKFFNPNKEYQEIYFDVCSQDGIYDRFVGCVRQLEGECDQLPHFRKQICESRAIKLSSYRYTWKYNLIHDVCYRTLPIFDSDFFKHEKCISEVINTRKWICDELHHTKVKSLNVPEVCHHWNNFRQCTNNEVTLRCGDPASRISEFLFHSHNSYFSKYSRCNFTGEPYTRCWYDWILERLPLSTTTTPTTTTTTTTTVAPSTTTTMANEIDDEDKEGDAVAPPVADVDNNEEEEEIQKSKKKGQEPIITENVGSTLNKQTIEFEAESTITTTTPKDSKNRIHKNVNPTESSSSSNHKQNSRIFQNDSNDQPRPTEPSTPSGGNNNKPGLSKLIRESKAISTAIPPEEVVVVESSSSASESGINANGQSLKGENQNSESQKSQSRSNSSNNTSHSTQKSILIISLCNILFFLLSALMLND